MDSQNKLDSGDFISTVALSFCNVFIVELYRVLCIHKLIEYLIIRFSISYYKISIEIQSDYALALSFLEWTAPIISFAIPLNQIKEKLLT